MKSETVHVPDLGVDVNVSTSVTSRLPADDDTPISVLIRFRADVTPAQVESVLGKLEPPADGIIVAAGHAVIVNARRPFIEIAEANPAVELVNPVQMKQWVPNRHRVTETTTE